MRQRRWVVLVCGLSAAILTAWTVWSRNHPHRGALEAVVEPITIVAGMSFDDGGSQGLRFRDASGVVRDICLEDTRVWEDDPSVLEGHHNIILNSFSPRGEGARRVAIAGVEERQLLGLLDRWARRDSDAKLIETRSEQYDRGEIDLEAFWKDLPAEARTKSTAVSILQELRRRN